MLRWSLALLRVCFSLMMALAALIAAPARAQNHIAARLVAESSAPAPGETTTLALVMTPAPGWHGYWTNPGEAGFPARFTWTLPPGAAAGAPDYPVPSTLNIAGLMNYVFEGEHAILFRLHVPPGLAKGAAIPVRLSAAWLACTDEICVPEQGEFTLTLHAGDGARDLAARFDGFRAKLPAPLAASGSFERKSGVLRLAIPYPVGAALENPHFFPLEGRTIDDAAPQKFEHAGDTLVATFSTPRDANAASISGVLSIGNGRGLSLSAVPGPVPDAPKPESTLITTLLAIGGALIGGLILNVMPCVFPILSLKALSLAKAGGDERAAQREALAYAAGAVLTLTALGALVLLLKVGWAFQLQDARVVFALALLMAVLTLNLAGLFELPMLGGGIEARGGFLTGALAAFVATPCTGPFMGAALGAALALPPVAALGVFAGLGLGLALPFLAIGFAPALRRHLPSPGPWMARFRHILAVPMAATALWLGWVLWRQAGPTGVLLLVAGIALLSLVLALHGRRQRSGASTGPTRVVALAIAAGSVAGMVVAAPIRPAAKQATAYAAPFSEARIAQLRAEGRPVFLYFTADWCLTCKVNERVAIDSDATRAAFARANVATLVGDWTNSDAAIGAFLTAQGRAGVPLYLYYRPGTANPQVLPQILTPAMLTALPGV